MKYQVHIGDALQELKKMPDQYVNCWVTSPPYWGLRDYGVDGQLGLEKTPEEYVAKMIEIFREARRVLRDDGTLWLNLGDSYCGNRSYQVPDSKNRHHVFGVSNALGIPLGYKCKEIIGIPWMVAFALRVDGWYLRQDIIWSKPNPMPESVKDRCTKSHEYLFLFSKSGKKIIWKNVKTGEWSKNPNLKQWYFDPIDKKRKPVWKGFDYYFDQDAIREPDSGQDHTRSILEGQDSLEPSGGIMKPHKGLRKCEGRNGQGRNKRSVWTVPTHPFHAAHFATFPPKLIEPCILAGCPEGGLVGDMFAGAGTTGVVTLKHFRRFVGIELNPQYVNEIAMPRIEAEASRHKQIPIFEGNEI